MNSAHAGPASPDPFLIAQPDGSTFQAIMRGDEFQGWMENADGYTIIKNSGSGFYEYATQGSGGELIPSGIPVTAAGMAKMTAQGLPAKRLRPPRHTALEQYQGEFLEAFSAGRVSSDSRAAPAQSGTWAPTPVSGPKKILVILVNFQNASLSSGAATYWSNAVHSASGASVAKYYQDNSYGAISISPVAHTQSGNPAGVVTVSLAQNHPNCDPCSYAIESAWINSALNAAKNLVNFPALDTNGDGTISVDETLVYFILAGYEASGSATKPSIWAHAWGGGGVSVSGKAVNHWALNGERLDSSLMQMGVIAHEMGHAMGGLPDLYDISGYNEGLGIFSLMASGSWGAKAGEVGGTTPVGLDAWTRQYLGWSTPQFPANGTIPQFVSPFSSASSTVMLMNSASSTSEYWLVENRPPVGWDAGMARSLGSSWTGGLLIQHIDLNIGSKSQNSFNKYIAGAHQGNMAEEPSTALCSLKAAQTAANSSRGCPTILFYSGNGTAFNGASTPNSNFYSGTASSLGITGISVPGSTMTGTVQTLSNVLAYTLTVNSSGATGVPITASPTTYAGTTNYNKTGIAAGTAITLTAPSTAGGVPFSSWSGCSSAVGVTCTVTMSAAKTVTASYATPTTYTLTVNSSGATGVAISASPTTYAGTTNYSKTGIAAGTAITLTAPSTAGGVPFSSWSGCSSAVGVTCTVTMSAAKTVTASYATPTTYTLTVNSSGASGVAISASPATYAGTTNYSKTGIAAGTAITLTAPSTKGSTPFSSWSGCATAVGPTCTVTMNASATVTASYGSSTGVNLLQNPGFESGAASWTESTLTSIPIISTGGSVPPHSGVYKAWLGGYSSALDTLEQSVAIPANTSTANIEFWYRISTAETTLVNVWDTLKVDLYNAAGTAKLATLGTFSNLGATGGLWVKSSPFNVLAYKGQTVRLRFTATTDSTNISSFFVDDVSLTATAAPHAKSITPILMLLLD